MKKILKKEIIAIILAIIAIWELLIRAIDNDTVNNIASFYKANIYQYMEIIITVLVIVFEILMVLNIFLLIKNIRKKSDNKELINLNFKNIICYQIMIVLAISILNYNKHCDCGEFLYIFPGYFVLAVFQVLAYVWVFRKEIFNEKTIIISIILFTIITVLLFIILEQTSLNRTGHFGIY